MLSLPTPASLFPCIRSMTSNLLASCTCLSGLSDASTPSRADRTSASGKLAAAPSMGCLMGTKKRSPDGRAKPRPTKAARTGDGSSHSATAAVSFAAPRVVTSAARPARSLTMVEGSAGVLVATKAAEAATSAFAPGASSPSKASRRPNSNCVKKSRSFCGAATARCRSAIPKGSSTSSRRRTSCRAMANMARPSASACPLLPLIFSTFANTPSSDP